MAEFLTHTRRNIFAIGALAGSVVVGACGETTPRDGTIVPKVPEQIETSQQVVESFDRGLSAPILLPDGRRITVIESSDDHYSETPIAMTEFCNGPDLMTTTEQFVFRGAAGGVDREVNHQWCADSILTEADFQVSQ